MYTNARLLNDQQVITSLKAISPIHTLLDIGCWDGELTLKYIEAAKPKKILGLELVEVEAKKARERGIETVAVFADKDLWPYADNSIDCVVSNQLVEHLTNIDHFLSEAYRVLKPGGYLVTSTNNLSSWHNIGALVLGWTPFDFTNCSTKVLGIGNPLAVHRGESDHHATWTHKCIYNPRWFKEWSEAYGLKHVKTRGAGYYPLPAKVGAWFPGHAAFMILTSRKPN